MSYLNRPAPAAHVDRQKLLPLAIGLILLGLLTTCTASRISRDQSPGIAREVSSGPDRDEGGDGGLKEKSQTQNAGGGSDTLQAIKPPPAAAASMADSAVNLRVVQVRYGNASYYGGEFAGRATASGEVYDPGRLTAAHRTLPFGTICRVTNLANGRQVLVVINDRGPFIRDRIIDLSFQAARSLGAILPGVVPVKVEILKK